MSDTPEKAQKNEKIDDSPAGAPPDEVADRDETEGVEGAEGDVAEAAAVSGDDASPEAIARRVAAFGEEDEAEKIARAEEQKLAERRAKMRRGKKGLEAAASKRLAKIAEKAEPKRAIPTAAPGADPLLDKTMKFSTWAKKNRQTVGIAVFAGVVAVAAFAGYTYYQQKREAEASAQLAAAVLDEHGRIGDPDKEKNDEGLGPKDPRPLFRTAEERRDAAIKKLREVETHFPGTGAAILARLSEGSLLLDARQNDAAAAAFIDVKGSPLGQMDAEVRGRALEGLGFAYEQKGDLETAIKTFKDLENTVDVLGFKELAIYHQARVSETKGDKDKAKELLKTLHERLNKPGETPPFPYLKEVADDRLRALDPSALPPKSSGKMGGPGGNQMGNEEIQKLIEQLKAKQQGGGGAP